jgi:hypothetical protein
LFILIEVCVAYGEAGGARTPDLRLRRPLLYPTELLPRKVRANMQPQCPTIKKPVTPCLEGWNSIRLSYGQRFLEPTIPHVLQRVADRSPLVGQPGEAGRGERIRTSDILVPNQARYRAALHPESKSPDRHVSERRDYTLACNPGQFYTCLKQALKILIASFRRSVVVTA